MEKKWDTVTPADLKRLFVNVCLAGHERVKTLKNTLKKTCPYMFHETVSVV
jgi:hypothetical protein